MRQQRGFTLIELVVVIAILGILAGIVLPRFLDAQASAKGAKVLANLRTIDSAINLYVTKNGVLPTEMDQITTDAPEDGKLLLMVTPGSYEGGEFIVKQNDGTEKSYKDVALASDYEIKAGRGVLGGDDRTVDYYLGNTGTNTSPGAGQYTSLGDNLELIAEANAATYINARGHVDSTAPEGSHGVADVLNVLGPDAFKNMGFEYWFFYYGELLLTNDKPTAGGTCTVLKYNVGTNNQYQGNFTVWKDCTPVLVTDNNGNTYYVARCNGKEVTGGDINKKDYTAVKAVYDNLVSGN